MSRPAADEPTGTSLPEKPAPVQSNMPPQAGQHQQQHQQQQQQHQQHLQPLELPQPEPFRPSRAFTLGKLTLASFNFVFAIITLGLAVGLVTWSIEFESFIGAIIVAVIAAISIVWQSAEFITLLTRRSTARPIHPGAHVGVHLVLWILGVLSVLSLALALSYALADWSVNAECDGSAAYWNGEYYEYCGYGDTFSSEGEAHRYFRLLEALVAFAVLLTAAHFVLFVLACVETDRRRRHGRRNRVVYLVAAPGAGPADGRAYYSQAPGAEVYGYYAPGAAGSSAA